MNPLDKAPVGWMKNKFKNKDVWLVDGDSFIIAVSVKNTLTGKEYWQIDKVVADCDGESFYLKTPEGEPYDDWTWHEVDFYIPVDAHGPMTKNQIERFL